VPTEKRQRQKEGQQARKEAALVAARKERRKKRRIVMAVAVVLIFGTMFIISAFGKNDKKTTKVASTGGSSTTVTTAAPASTTPTSAKPAVPAAGTAPVTKLEVEDMKVGTGKVVKAGDTIVAHYLGATYKDGKQFESSWDSGQTFEAVVGEGQLIKGWDEGIPGMKVGGRRKLVIPQALAYPNPQGGQPAGDLVFIVDVYAIK
jgi:peptidylprolyl isomerase